MTSASSLALYSAGAIALAAVVAVALIAVWCEHRRKTAIARACEYVNEGS